MRSQKLLSACDCEDREAGGVPGYLRFASHAFQAFLCQLIYFTMSPFPPASPSTPPLLTPHLLHNIIPILPRKRHILRMTPSRHQLILRIHKLNTRVRQRLANYTSLISKTHIPAALHHRLHGTRKNSHLSQTTSARIKSPTFPPEFKYVTFKSVLTPVANSPLDATAREPPKSTMEAIVPP